MKVTHTLIDKSGQQSLSEIKLDSYLSILFFSFQDFLRWWYVKMPLWHLRRIARFSVVLDDQFSISLLLANFFVPWHRDYSVVGYLFGIIMKLLFLPIAISIYILCMTISILVFLIWLILPISILVFLIVSFF